MGSQGGPDPLQWAVSMIHQSIPERERGCSCGYDCKSLHSVERCPAGTPQHVYVQIQISVDRWTLASLAGGASLTVSILLGVLGRMFAAGLPHLAHPGAVFHIEDAVG